MTAKSVKKDKLYDTKNILDLIKEQNKVATRRPPLPITDPVNPKKRSLKGKIVFPPTKIKSKKSQKKIEDSFKCGTTRSSPGRPIRKRGQVLQYAKTRVIKKVHFETAKCLPSNHFKKKRATVKIHSCETHRSSKISVDIRNDARIVKNIATKQKVSIEYPREEFLHEIKYETCSISPIEKPRMRVRPFTDLNTSRDLKIEVQDSQPTVITASEKECAIKILPSLYKFHQISQLNRITKGFEEQSLIETLSRLSVKNFKIERFLEFLTCKFKQEYKVSVGMKRLARYLHSMLVSLNRQYCSNQFVTNFAKEVDEFVRFKCKVEESNTCNNLNGLQDVVFTQMQLEQLRYQIQQYSLIASTSSIPSKQENRSDEEVVVFTEMHLKQLRYQIRQYNLIASACLQDKKANLIKKKPDEILEFTEHKE